MRKARNKKISEKDKAEVRKFKSFLKAYSESPLTTLQTPKTHEYLNITEEEAWHLAKAKNAKKKPSGL